MSKQLFVHLSTGNVYGIEGERAYDLLCELKEKFPEKVETNTESVTGSWVPTMQELHKRFKVVHKKSYVVLIKDKKSGKILEYVGDYNQLVSYVEKKFQTTFDGYPQMDEKQFEDEEKKRKDGELPTPMKEGDVPVFQQVKTEEKNDLDEIKTNQKPKNVQKPTLIENIKIAPTLNKKGFYSVHVEVRAGYDLPAMDRTGTSDPYVTLKHGQEFFKTKKIMKTLNPKWPEGQEIYTFALGKQEEFEKALPLHVECYDWDRFSSDDFIGQFDIKFDLEEFPPNKKVIKKFKLLPRNEKDTHTKGEIELGIKITLV
ncbi:c2 domain-containing protein [Anaeramoeba ignava]|uniref:C2 domain-containing protein n=1 Tax=Anaeramoeba ignava TaxID=1746090 RepID=A0A9Q0LHD6_ANAIG|nr:c2 domain-containing protein [Anaeramoeba ignava]